MYIYQKTFSIRLIYKNTLSLKYEFKYSFRSTEIGHIALIIFKNLRSKKWPDTHLLRQTQEGVLESKSLCINTVRQIQTETNSGSSCGEFKKLTVRGQDC